MVDDEVCGNQGAVKFQGVREKVLARTADNDHVLAVVLYKFPCGSRRMYVEAYETHTKGGKYSLIQLSEAVHLLQNATESELYSIGGRELPEALDKTKGV